MINRKSLREITEENYLDKRLEEYAKSDYYPFHMPGHKRQLRESVSPWQIDITEIDGFDNLHAPEEILKDAQNRAALLYGAAHSYFLVNGSTCGILAAVSAAVKRGGKLLIARNCHRAVYHAAYLRGLSLEYVYPVIRESGIQGEILPRDIEQALTESESGSGQAIEAVMLTSPTYDGIVSDTAAIARICHSHGVPLLVDEAHGAHFGFHPYFPQTAVRLGADVVIQSMHKTLPSLTQTALLHVNSSRVQAQQIQKFLDIYETSSPSYVLMAGMDRCLRMLSGQREELFSAYVDKLEKFYQRVDGLERLHVLKPGTEVSDPSKLLIFGTGLGRTGRELYELLLQRYHLQMELCSGGYVLAMTSFLDTQEGFDRLGDALWEIEREAGNNGTWQYAKETNSFISHIYRRVPKRLEIGEAWDREKKELSLKEAVGETAGEFINLYPPGIPLLAPGEEITGELLEGIEECVHRGLSVQGLGGNLRIKVVN